MLILFNDQEIEVNSSCTLDEVLNLHLTVNQNFAVSVNAQLVHRGSYQTRRLEDYDRIDILLPMQGG
jgi:thiamine biosynthesis protein ThiS